MRFSGMAALLLTSCIGAPSPVAPMMGGSVGVPHQGALRDGAALADRSEGLQRLRTDERRWGHPRMVAAIERAAARVARERPGGAPLVVADLSAKNGGRIDGHRSHRSGRDADLLFYALTPDGRSIPSPGFIHFGPDGLAPFRDGFVRLDVDRTWLLVRALSEDDTALTQRLFVARWLEALIIEHARARGEPDAIVWRAETLLRQPGDSFAHDDHLHLRIACSAEDETAGCEGGGPRWPWMPAPSAIAVSDAELIEALFDDPAPQPIAAVHR